MHHVENLLDAECYACLHNVLKASVENVVKTQCSARCPHRLGPRTFTVFWNRFEVSTNVRFNHGSWKVLKTYWETVVHTEWEHAVLPCFGTVFKCPHICVLTTVHAMFRTRIGKPLFTQNGNTHFCHVLEPFSSVHTYAF